MKNNQKSLLEQIKHGCKVQKPIEIYEGEIEKAHGRIEQRKYEVFDSNPMLKNWRKDWPYIRRIIKVTRYREEIKKKEPTVSVHYYVSNRSLDIEKYAKYIREHWFIENKNYTILKILHSMRINVINALILRLC